MGSDDLHRQLLCDGLNQERGTSHRSVSTGYLSLFYGGPALVCVTLFFVVPFILSVPVSLTSGQ